MLERLYGMKWIDNIFDEMYLQFSNLYRVWRDNKKVRLISCGLLITVSLLIIFCIQSDIGNDVKDYQQYWLSYIKDDGLFGIYKHMYNVKHRTNYPPLYYAFLFLMQPIFDWFMSLFGTHGIAIVLKISTLLIHCVVGFSLYRKNPKLSFVWFFNSACIWLFTSTIHFDAFFGFLMILFLYYIDEDNIKMTVIIFTIMTLLKLQGLYFAPVILFSMLQSNRKREWIKWIAICLLISVAIFLPFMLESNNKMLMFDLYFKNVTSQYTSCHVTSLWYFVLLFVYTINSNILEKPSFVMSIVALCLIFMCVFCLYKRMKKFKISYAVYIYMLLINFLTLSQDYRYSIYCVLLGLYVSIKYNNRALLKYVSKLEILSWFCVFACSFLMTFLSRDSFIVYLIYLALYFIVWLCYVQVVMNYFKHESDFDGIFMNEQKHIQ